MREREIEIYLVKRTRALGGECRKVVFPNHNGAPDRLVLLPKGKHFWAEVKAPDGKLKPHQIREILKLRDKAQVVFVIRSKADVDKFFCMMDEQ